MKGSIFEKRLIAGAQLVDPRLVGQHLEHGQRTRMAWAQIERRARQLAGLHVSGADGDAKVQLRHGAIRHALALLRFSPYLEQRNELLDQVPIAHGPEHRKERGFVAWVRLETSG